MLLALAACLAVMTPAPRDTVDAVVAAVAYMVEGDSTALRGAAGYVTMRVRRADGDTEVVPASSLLAAVGERLGIAMRPQSDVIRCGSAEEAAVRGVGPMCTLDARSFWGITLDSVDVEQGTAVISVRVTRRGASPDRLYAHALLLELERRQETWMVTRVRMSAAT